MYLPLWVVAATAFPIVEISLTPSQIALINNASTPQPIKDAAATTALLPLLQSFFNVTEHAIKIDAQDANVSWTGPDQVVDGSCDHKVTAEHPKGSGTMLNTSYLTFGTSKMNWSSIAVFADGQVDSALDIDTDIKVELGKHVFGR